MRIATACLLAMLALVAPAQREQYQTLHGYYKRSDFEFYYKSSVTKVDDTYQYVYLFKYMSKQDKMTMHVSLFDEPVELENDIWKCVQLFSKEHPRHCVWQC